MASARAKQTALLVAVEFLHQHGKTRAGSGRGRRVREPAPEANRRAPAAPRPARSETGPAAVPSRFSAVRRGDMRPEDRRGMGAAGPRPGVETVSLDSGHRGG